MAENPLQQFGRTKIAGVPAPVAVLGIGVAGYLVYRTFSRPRAAPGSTGATAEPGPESIYGLGFAQGLQGYAAGQAPPPAPKPAPPQVTLGNPQSRQTQIALWRTPNNDVNPTGADVAAVLPAGTQLPSAGSAVAGTYHRDELGRAGALWQPVTYKGETLYVWEPDTVLGQLVAGVGGAAKSIGSRVNDLMWHGHPLLKQRVRYPQYVRARGGPAQHQAEAHRVARQAGVHPAQVLAANPHYTGLIRVR